MGATYRIEQPDGSVYQVEMPEETISPPSSPPSFLPFAGTSVGDVAESGKQYLGNMAQAVMHPIQTLQGLGNTALGVVEKAIPGQQPQEPYADALGEFIKQRYGSFDRLKETWKHDPVGVVADASMLMSAGAGTVAKIGDIAAIPKLAKMGRMATTVGESLDPLVATIRAAKFAGRSPARGVTGAMQRTAGYEINSLIKPKNRQFSYGRNPGRAVAEEGIIAGSLEELAQKTSDRYQQIGEQIGQVLQSPAVASKSINISHALDPITNAITKAQKNPRTNEMIIRRLENVRDDLLGRAVNPDGTPGPITRDLTKMTPVEAFSLKRTIGELTKWTEQYSDDTVVNASLKQSYGKIRAAIEQATPGIKPLNERFANLLEASTAARNQSYNLQRHNPNLLSMPNVLAGGLGYSVGNSLPAAATGVLLAQGARMAVQSPWIRTQLARFIAHSTPSEIASFFNRIPGLQNEMTRAGLLAGTAYQRMESQPVQ